MENDSDYTDENDLFSDTGMLKQLHGLYSNADLQKLSLPQGSYSAKLNTLNARSNKNNDEKNLDYTDTQIIAVENDIKTSQDNFLSLIPKSSKAQIQHEIDGNFIPSDSNLIKLNKAKSKIDSLEKVRTKLLQKRNNLEKKVVKSKLVNIPTIINLTKNIEKIAKDLAIDSILVRQFNDFLSNPYIIKDSNVKFQTVDNPPLRTEYIETEPIDEPKRKKITLYAKTDKDSVVYRHINFKVGKPERFSVSFGGAFALGNVSTYEVTGGDSAFNIQSTAKPLRFVAGLHYYIKKHFKLDNSFLGLRTNKYLERVSVYGGLEVAKKPFNNFYLGASYDIIPGIKFITGIQGTRNDRYFILNNAVLSSKVHYNFYPFISLSVSPTSLTSLISLINLL